MKALIIALAIAAPGAYAQVSTVAIKNFNFTYSSPFGEGSAASFSRSFINQEVSVSVEKIDKDFRLVTSGAEDHEFLLKDAPSFMTGAETMSVSGFNLDFNEKLTLTLAKGHFLSKEDSLKLTGLSLDCHRAAASKEVMDQLIHGCIQKMSLKGSKFNSQSLNESFSQVMEESLNTVLELKGDLGINSLDLKTSNGKYDLSAEVKSQISGKVRSNGDMSYDEVAGKLTVKIKEVKFGILNITGKVFDELKKNQSEKLQVKEPYVYYLVK